MQLKVTIRRAILLTLATASFAVGCGDDDDGGNATSTFRLVIENISQAYDFTQSDAFTVPTGSDGPGPIGPGGAYSVAFDAAVGDRLSFATMFVPSNDYFYAPDEEGIALFDEDGNPVTGDITDQVDIWDSGTEINEEPGLGPNQVQRQPGPDSGPADPNPNVRLAGDALPLVEEVLRATLTSTSDTGFVLLIENVSNEATLATGDGGFQPVPLSPGVFVVHTDPAPLFEVGVPDRGEGLEAIAEDGDVATLARNLGNRTGITAVLAPGVAVVHDGEAPLFEPDTPDRGDGLEAIAEDGDPSELAAALASKPGIAQVSVFNTPSGEDGPGPLSPGRFYDATFVAEAGQRISFATMYVQSNDLFLGPDELGIDLFDASGNPLSGNVTAQTLLWDAGTEVDQVPGVGPDQAPRQSGPDTGADDPDDLVRLADDPTGRLGREADYVRVSLEIVE